MTFKNALDQEFILRFDMADMKKSKLLLNYGLAVFVLTFFIWILEGFKFSFVVGLQIVIGTMLFWLSKKKRDRGL